ncbi:uncharacterized protein Dmoj_GI26677 [Drosophila mojavensis]|uniref:Uncharacterized protein n=1 Tax=Drosophila mojavensis TaxID=7230 RepID=A0A0Q9XC86_DROMO|nr:uncharacterized protein Dmoj_GI26677 [Drosophila mojavensis]
MTSRKHYVYAWISYIVAFSGVSEFYFDIRTDNIRKSRLLRIYSRIISLYLLCHFGNYWLALQLTWQNTNVHLFNVVTINP